MKIILINYYPINNQHTKLIKINVNFGHLTNQIEFIKHINDINVKKL